jgi:BlaI family transcriptional regulator, penicillinase repressor
MAPSRTPPVEKLTRREREIMDAIFALQNRGSVDEIRPRLLHPPTYSAVRAMLVRLEKKGYIRHQEEGPRYIYSATISHSAARRAALQQYIRTFFGGSASQMMTALVRQEKWTEDELDALQSEIQRVRKERKS